MHQTPPIHDEVFDAILREELAWQAPPELTDTLLRLAHEHTTAPAPVATAAPAPVPGAADGPQLWYTRLAMVLTALAIGVSLVVAWQVYGMLGTELGITALWHPVEQMIASGIGWLYNQLPWLTHLTTAFANIQEYLHWLLIAFVLWLALDGWKPAPQQHMQHASG